MLNPTTGLVVSSYVDPKITSRLRERGLKTPDIHELKFFKRIPLFVYGLETRGGPENNLLTGAEYLGKGHTVANCFYMKQNAYFPLAFPTTTEDTRKAKIRGELYNVSPEHILTLDASNSNLKTFIRIKHRILMEEQKPAGYKMFGDMSYTLAFMYIGNSEYWTSNDKLTLRPRISYPSEKKLQGTTFYEWDNREDDENDEWGYRVPEAEFWSNNRYGRHGIN